MSDARAEILGRIGAAVGGDDTRAATVRARLSEHGRNLVPRRGQVTGAEARDAFTTRMGANAGTVQHLSGVAQILPAIADYLRAQSVTGPLRLQPDPVLCGLDRAPLAPWEVREGVPAPEDATGVSVAFAGIAETGSLLMHSGDDAPTLMNFLPENHIAILPSCRLVGALEEGWDRLRRARNNQMPRAVNLISGPSRSADIAMTMIMGAHGPKRLHVLMVEGDDWQEI